jgi:MarC family integral membrane protein
MGSASAACLIIPARELIGPRTDVPTVGPGSISVAVVLGSQRPQAASSVTDITLLVDAAVLGLAAMALTIYFSYRFTDRMVSVLGESGINVLIRLSAPILLALAPRFSGAVTARSFQPCPTFNNPNYHAPPFLVALYQTYSASEGEVSPFIAG